MISSSKLDPNQITAIELKTLELKHSQTVENIELKVQNQRIHIVRLYIEVLDLLKRTSSKECYTSEDCISFHNYPVKGHSPDLYVDMCTLVKCHKNNEVISADIKACYLLKRGNNPPVVIERSSSSKTSRFIEDAKS